MGYNSNFAGVIYGHGNRENNRYIVPAVGKTADDAIRLYAAHLPNLILMDIHLKGKMDGIEAAAEIRKTSDVTIVFLTAYADPATVERAKTRSKPAT